MRETGLRPGAGSHSIIRKMKILHVININAVGGAEKLIPVLLTALVNSGVEAECLIIHPSANGEAANYIASVLTEKKIKVCLLSRRSPVDIKAILEVGNFISAGGYKLVHSHLRHADFWISLLKLMRKVRVPIVTTMHGYRDSFQNKYGLDYKKVSFLSPYYWAARLILKKFDAIVFISNCISGFYYGAKLTRTKKSCVIYHGYPVLEGRKRTGSTIFREKDRINIAIPGRLIRMKGHRYALEAFKYLLADFPNAALHIFGSGPEEAEIRRLINEWGLGKNVEMYGYVENLNDCMALMDVVLIPSLGESFGMVFLESFANKVPVVAFNLPAGNEIVSDGYSGLLSEPGRPMGLYEKLKLLLQDDRLYSRISENAFEELSKRFSVEVMGEAYKKFYSGVLLSQSNRKNKRNV